MVKIFLAGKISLKTSLRREVRLRVTCKQPRPVTLARVALFPKSQEAFRQQLGI
jgi:hypothetical protein